MSMSMHGSGKAEGSLSNRVPAGRRGRGFRRVLSLIGVGVVVVVGGCVGGCVSQGTARREQLKAYEEGRQKAMEEQEKAAQTGPVVLFRGDIRNPRVPWREGLTLAEALLAAQYTWNWDPHTITVLRDGRSYPVNPKMLLRGTENPLLEEGDIVEVRH